MGSEPNRTQRIPLFPLEVVLLPGAPLPLHIFEPRYKEMIGLCLERRVEFGVVLQRASQIVTTGCTAEILKLLQRYPDGRMDILTAGRTPFAIEELIDEKAYYEAQVAFLDDEAAPAIADHRMAALLELYREAHVTGHAAKPAMTQSGASLAYHIAGELPLELEARQALLELRSEAARQEYLFSYLTHWLPRVRRMRHVKSRAGGNGHG